MVLVCNDPAAADVVLSRWRHVPAPDLERRIARMQGRTPGACPVAAD
jgi:hypothetical protein